MQILYKSKITNELKTNEEWRAHYRQFGFEGHQLDYYITINTTQVVCKPLDEVLSRLDRNAVRSFYTPIADVLASLSTQAVK